MIAHDCMSFRSAKCDQSHVLVFTFGILNDWFLAGLETDTEMIYLIKQRYRLEQCYLGLEIQQDFFFVTVELFILINSNFPAREHSFDMYIYG